MSEPRYRQLRRSRADDIPATVARIFSYLANFKWHLLLVLVCIVTESLVNVASSAFFAPLIDDYILPLVGQSNPDFTRFIHRLIFMGCVYLLGITAGYVYRKLMSVISTGTLYNIRKQLFEHMQEMSVQFYDTHTHGELMNFYTNDVDIIRPLIADSLPQAINTLISLSGSMIMMLTLSPKLTLVAVTLLVLVILVSYFVGKNARKYFVRVQKTVSDINGYSEEMFLGSKVVKVFCYEDESVRKFQKYNDECMHASIMSNLFAQSLMPINVNLSYISYAAVAVLGAQMCIRGELSLGSVASFLLYTRQIAGPISGLSQQFNGMMMSIAGAERVFGIIDSPTEVDDGRIILVNVREENGRLVETEEKTERYAWKNPEDGSLTELKGDIRFKNVTFAYEEGKTVLNDISLYAKPGQKIALVGSTGAGKTTITNLINRFYDVQEGQITYDGIDVKDIKKDSLRKSLGVVLQDTNLFSGTVMDNIRYGNLEATDEECIAAAKLANADSFINRLPEGYNTMLSSNGTNLSQGQRQLLNIARATVADPPVLILDEATSALDNLTQLTVRKSLDELNVTRIIIAHRLSTIINADRIYVMKDGQVIETGNYEELMAQNGYFAELARRQNV